MKEDTWFNKDCMEIPIDWKMGIVCPTNNKR
jgi:hypothetical protein